MMQAFDQSVAICAEDAGSISARDATEAAAIVGAVSSPEGLVVLLR
jgi:hypothetical protein